MTEILFDKALNEKIMKGVNTLADAVSTTLGPKGRTIIIKQKDRKPFITKDGVTCCRAVKLNDPFENLGVEIVKQAAESTLESAGDGTTTSTLLTQTLLNKVQPYLASNISPIELKRGIDAAVKDVIDVIKKQVIPITSLEQIEQIATISANGDKGIGKLLSLAVDKIGRDGSITIQESKSIETSLDVTEGFTFDSGLIAPMFITDERRGVCRYEDCLVMITDRCISVAEEITPVLEIVARDSRPFVIIAEQIEGQALAMLLMNNAKGVLKIAPIKAPKYGEERRNILKDLALVTGAKIVSRETGMLFQQVKLTDLGTARIVETSKYTTTIVSNGKQEKDVQHHLGILREHLKNEPNMAECSKIMERINRLGSGIATIKVGGATEVEMIEKKHRVEDALEAINAAQKEGVVIGGGCALLRASLSLKNTSNEHSFGYKIVLDAIREPFRKIMKNAGLSPDVCENKVLLEDNWNFGFDASSSETCLLIDKGIVDPFRVVRSALENAASAATTLMMSSVGIVEV